jgi:hypothetical protein
VWCQYNNLSLNVSKTMEVIVDYRKGGPLTSKGLKWSGSRVSSSFPNELSWSKDSCEEGTTTPFPPQRFGMGPQILKKLYICTLESILTCCITANCSVSDSKVLQRVVRTSQYITRAKFPDIQDLYTRWCQRKAQKIVKDSSHPSHRLFSLLPHSKRYRSAKSRIKMLL